MTMISRDARRLPAAALEDLRRRAVAAVEAGVSRTEVARLFGVSRQTVGAWVLSYRDNGEEAFRPRQRGRRPGEQLALSDSQQTVVVKTIVTGSPEDVGLPYWVWTRPAVAELINREFRVTLSVKTVSRYLLRWGLIPGTNPLELVRGGKITTGTERSDRAEVVWLMWTSPHSPLESGYAAAGLGEGIAPSFFEQFREVNVLLATGNTGMLYFDARLEPFDAGHAGGFLRRLAAQIGRAVDVVVCRWPIDHVDAVPRDVDAPVSVRFSAG
jgi:transposase